jgi:hypothetical protein
MAFYVIILLMIFNWFNNTPLFYEKILKKLHENKIQYIMAGGLAVSLHGAVRFTADIDIILSFDKENIEKFISLMDKLGYKPKPPVDPKHLADPEIRKKWFNEKNMKVFSFYHPDKPIEIIDVFIDNPIDFNELDRRKTLKKAKDIEIPIASIDDLIELKKLAGRDQDIIDIKNLLKIKNQYE